MAGVVTTTIPQLESKYGTHTTNIQNIFTTNTLTITLYRLMYLLIIPFCYKMSDMLIVIVFLYSFMVSTHLFRCLRGDWAGMDDPLVYNCSVAVAEAQAAK